MADILDRHWNGDNNQRYETRVIHHWKGQGGEEPTMELLGIVPYSREVRERDRKECKEEK